MNETEIINLKKKTEKKSREINDESNVTPIDLHIHRASNKWEDVA